MKAEKALNKLSKFPLGSRVAYSNPGRPGHGQAAKIVQYLLFPDGGYYGALLQWNPFRSSTVTINQLNKYYLILPS